MLRAIQLPYNFNRFKKRSREDEFFSLVGNSGGWYDRSEQSTLKFVTEITHQSKLYSYIVQRASKKTSRNLGSRWWGHIFLWCISLIKVGVDFLFNESNSNFFCNLDETSWWGEIEIKIVANWRNAVPCRKQFTSALEGKDGLSSRSYSAEEYRRSAFRIRSSLYCIHHCSIC